MPSVDTKKAVQAAAVLLKRAHGREMPYLRLLKLLYIADRESFRETMRPILGGKTVAMKKGPLHSEVYDLIKQHGGLWGRHVCLDEYDVELVDDPGDSELSDYEVELLSRVAEKYSDLTEWQLVELTHQFSEWLKNYPDPTANTSHRIHLSDILDAVGLQEQKGAILAAIRHESNEHLAFRGTIAETFD
jgi:uncharacterized phage-associated protein